MPGFEFQVEASGYVSDAQGNLIVQPTEEVE